MSRLHKLSSEFDKKAFKRKGHRRTWFEIDYAILFAASKPASLYRLKSAAYLPNDRFQSHLTGLRKKGYIKEFTNDGKVFYQVTDSGKLYMKKVRVVLDLSS